MWAICTWLQHKLPRRTFAEKTFAPLGLIHTDVCGNNSPIFWDNQRYVLKDDFTNFYAVYFMKNKSEVSSYFKDFEAFVMNCIGRKIQHILCDSGKEYISNQIRDHCGEHAWHSYRIHRPNSL